MDKIAKGVIAVAIDRSCAKCHQSWVLQPTNQDVKNGATEGRMYCCAEKARVKLNDGVYPRLALLTREDKELCGPKGKWFEPTREVPLGIIPDSQPVRHIRRGPSRSPAKNPPAAVEAQRAVLAPARKPYKVS